MSKKIISGLMAALVAISPVLAVTLGDFQKHLGVPAQDWYIVIGSAADPADVAGAVDIAIRLAELSYEEKEVPGVTTTEINGVEKDTVPLSGQLTQVFPTKITTIQYSGLKDSTFSWRGNDYDYHEEIVLGSIQMKHDFNTDKINGTEKMVVSSTSGLKYRFVFDKEISGLGSPSDKNYTYPVTINLLGTTAFTIVGVGSSSIVALVGTTGTATAETPVTYGDYSFYSDLGSDGSWARIIVKDKDGNTVATKVINQGDSHDFTEIGVTVKVTQVRALQDGTVVGVDLVVGETGQVEKTYTTSCDVTSTGAASTRFPGTEEWCIQFSPASSTNGKIARGAAIEVVFKPTETKYYKAGEKLVLPNEYAEIGFEGWNTDKFVTITVQPISEKTVYNINDDDQSLGTWSAIEFSADVDGSIEDPVTGVGYTKAYILFNYTQKEGNVEYLPVLLAFYDPVKQKVLGNVSTGYYTKANLTEGSGSVSFTFNISYAGSAATQAEVPITVKVYNSTSGPVEITVGNALTFNYTYRTSPSTTALPQFYLGDESSAADDDVRADAEDDTDTSFNSTIGKATQNVVTDAGVIAVSPASYSGSQKVKFKVPAEKLYVKAYVGKAGETVTEGATYKEMVPVTAPIAVMDTEVTSTHRAANLITVGGPCVNRITAEALGLTYPACGAASTIPEDAAMLKIVEDFPADGKFTLIVAGWEKENTRTAAEVVQKYDTLLKDITEKAVKVTAATATGITPLTTEETGSETGGETTE